MKIAPFNAGAINNKSSKANKIKEIIAKLNKEIPGLNLKPNQMNSVSSDTFNNVVNLK